MSESKKTRVTHVDVARGISITLVALFHSKVSLYFPSFMDALSVLRMPFFFFISGLFFNLNTDLNRIVSSKASALLKPYLVTLVLVLLASTVLQGESFMIQALGILYGNGDTLKWTPLWFLVHLFWIYVLAKLFYSFVLYKIESALSIVVILIAILLVGAYNLSLMYSPNTLGEKVYFSGLPHSLDIILVSLPYFLLGSYLKQYVLQFKANLVAATLAIAVFFSIVLFVQPQVDLNRRIFEFPMYSVVASFAGIYLMVQVAYLLSKVSLLSNCFIRLGQASLFILIFHVYLGAVSNKIITRFVEPSVLIAFVTFIISIVAPIVIFEIVKRNAILTRLYLPQAKKSSN
jgi:fucose 4-O-acetylase-like acetyltransferase